MTGALKPLSTSRDTLLDRLGRLIADRLQSQTSGYEPYTPSDPETLARTLRPGDILLVEGNQKVSAAIKYLTQSTWSHAALFVGDAVPLTLDQAALPATERPQLVEVNLGEGCVAVPLTKYRTYNTRICRPIGLTPEDRIAQEPTEGNPYRNFIAVKQGSENEAWVKTLVASYQNDTVKAEFDKVYKGTGQSAY